MTTTSEAAIPHLPAGRTTVVGYPVRAQFWSYDRASARTALGLPADATVVLVAAGSLGARAINDAVFASLPRLLERAVVLHMTGAADEQRAIEARARLSPEQQKRYLVHAYLEDMPAAMHAADLVVCRSGASTLGELPAAGAAAILIPGQYEGWSQAPNAEYLQAHDAALILGDRDLGDLVLQLLSDPARLESMRAAARTLARPDAAADIARILQEVAA
jgi:UDP-N-acetylglucosamine--N-acetylmuramyl-(pentapeptide) pyrophosphoryl-undecaprenol N-acetylglucosamine transferase